MANSLNMRTEICGLDFSYNSIQLNFQWQQCADAKLFSSRVHFVEWKEKFFDVPAFAFALFHLSGSIDIYRPYPPTHTPPPPPELLTHAHTTSPYPPNHLSVPLSLAHTDIHTLSERFCFFVLGPGQTGCISARSMWFDELFTWRGSRERNKLLTAAICGWTLILFPYSRKKQADCS